MDERISAEETDLLEQKQAMKELSKERRSTEVEEWRDKAAAGGITWRAVVWSRSSATEGGLLFVRSGSSSKDTEEDQRSYGQVQKRRAAVRVESAEKRDYVSAEALASHLEQKM